MNVWMEGEETCWVQCYMCTVILPTCTYVLKYVLILRVAGQCMCT